MNVFIHGQVVYTKSLHTSPVLHESDNEKEDAEFISQENKPCVANMTVRGVIRWGDFVVLRELTFDSLASSRRFLTLFMEVRFASHHCDM